MSKFNKNKYGILMIHYVMSINFFVESILLFPRKKWLHFFVLGIALLLIIGKWKVMNDIAMTNTFAVVSRVFLFAVQIFFLATKYLKIWYLIGLIEIVIFIWKVKIFRD